MNKICTKCKIEKDYSQFHKLKLGKQGLNPVCNTCRNTQQRANRDLNGYRSQIKYKYGLSYEDYLNLLEKQNGICCGCKNPFYIDKDSLSIPCIDHNHITGKVRGILCKRCNLALGYVNDNPKTLSNLIEYLSICP